AVRDGPHLTDMDDDTRSGRTLLLQARAGLALAPRPAPGAPAREDLAPLRAPRPAPAPWLYPAFIVLAGCLAYLRVLGDYFVLDDFQLLDRASRVPWWSAFRPWPSFEGLAYYWL